MAIVYVSSMDQYGPDLASPNNPTVGSTWQFSDGLLIGDGWSAEPLMAASGNTYARGTIGLSTPAWGARQGDLALVADQFTCLKTGTGGTVYNSVGTEAMLLAIPGATQATRLVHFAFSCSALPALDVIHGQICHFMTSGGAILFRLGVDPSGRLFLANNDPISAPLSTTPAAGRPVVEQRSASPVISPNTWFYLSIEFVQVAPGDVNISVYVGDIAAENLVLSGTGLTFVPSGNADVIGFLPASFVLRTPSPDAVADLTQRAVRDIVICDTTGTRNNALLGQCFVSAQEMRDEDVGSGWTAYPRENIGTGILSNVDGQAAVRFATAATLDPGAGDFTFETFARFKTLPTGSETMVLISKWRAAAGLRSYMLYYDAVDGTLVWSISTDGAATTDVKRVPWAPLTGRWYHVAVSRSTAQTLLFIDGLQLGVPVADANTYYAGTAFLGVAGQFLSSGLTDTTTLFDGWMDETRITIGTARYTADFTPPTTPFGRTVGTDPDFADVVLLMGYEDDTIVDESSYNRTRTLNTPVATAQTPDDGFAPYAVLNQRPAWDDTYIEAALLAAEGLFTFEALPLATETITIGATVYTWVSTLVSAYDVLIGANVAACVSNIIAAINAGAGEGTVYGTGTVAHPTVQALSFLSPQFKLRASTVGAAGNAIATTDTVTDGFFRDATLVGGQDIPAASTFAIERLPSDATGVLGAQVTSRVYKTDAGSAQVRFDLVGPSDGVGLGTAATVDLNPAWARQVFETDPDTAGSLTPSTMNAGRIRITRTL
jgi:hypothetical protein